MPYNTEYTYTNDTGGSAFDHANTYSNGESVPYNSEYEVLYSNVSKDETIPLSNVSRRMNGYGPPMNGGHETNGIAAMEEKEKSRRHCVLTYSAILASVTALILCSASLFLGSFQLHSNGNQQPQTKPLFDELDRYIVDDYDARSVFSDFLPGVAGVYGKPVWAFFVNRGQCMASFGLRSKNFPIMEFNAANKAYQNTPSLGFRTFLQGTRGKKKTFLAEPFSPQTTCYDGGENNNNNFHQSRRKPKRRMFVGPSEIQIQEIDWENEIETNVTYFVLPDESYPALVRRTVVTNLARREDLSLSLLDGLARIEPRGGEINRMLKDEGFSTQASMGVYRPYKNSLAYPFYRLLRGPEYFASEPGEQRAGHFCLAIMEGDNPHLLPIVYDTSRVFGQDTSLLNPLRLHEKTVAEILDEPQYGFGVTSSAFAAVDAKTLKPGQSVALSSFYGEASFMLQVPVIMRRITMYGFVQFKQARSREAIKQVTAAVATVSGNKTFDIHARQMLLDNSLRGGTPMILGEVDDVAKLKTFDEDPRLKVYHVFSRFDGDLERDYNDFEVDPLFYSQGSGKFQEVIQNRRNDVVLHPRTASFAVQMFLSFIQADGYEPLIVDGVKLELSDWDACNQIALEAVGPADGHRAQRDGLRGILNDGPFRFGEVFKFMEESNVQLIISRSAFVDKVAAAATVVPVARFGEGYWPDHWIYYLDLIESYLSIFPDGEQILMYDQSLPYFFSPAFVQPRHNKYVLIPPSFRNGKGFHVEQVNATILCEEKTALMASLANGTGKDGALATQWQRTQNGIVFKSSPIAKLLLLSTLKFATRDSLGMGIEYEAGRAGWNNAMEGLARSLGSGISEAYELVRLLEYVYSVVFKYQRPVTVPTEVSVLIDSVNAALKEFEAYQTNHTLEIPKGDVDFEVPDGYMMYWNNVSRARESFRESTKLTFMGSTQDIWPSSLLPTLESWIQHTKAGIDRAMSFGIQNESGGKSNATALPPTYFSYRIEDWEVIDRASPGSQQFVEARKLSLHRYPLFLEGAVRKMAASNSSAEAKAVYTELQTSGLRDKELGMYTLSTSLAAESEDLGKVMTYTPGWFDNQSVWLDLSYKLYLQLLKWGLLKEFFEVFTSGEMLPFMDPEKYGRPIMESSTFIASSAFENPAVRGRGVLARLSGASEFLGMWSLMMIGPEPFSLDASGQLCLQLLPALPLWMFQETLNPGIGTNGSELTVSYNLFAQTNVTYYNRRRADLMRIAPSGYEIGMRDGSIHNVVGPTIPTVLADKIRRVIFVNYINVFFD